jgi:hypothetical protein
MVLTGSNLPRWRFASSTPHSSRLFFKHQRSSDRPGLDLFITVIVSFAVFFVFDFVMSPANCEYRHLFSVLSGSHLHQQPASTCTQAHFCKPATSAGETIVFSGPRFSSVAVRHHETAPSNTPRLLRVNKTRLAADKHKANTKEATPRLLSQSLPNHSP